MVSWNMRGWNTNLGTRKIDKILWIKNVMRPDVIQTQEAKHPPSKVKGYKIFCSTPVMVKNKDGTIRKDKMGKERG